jgi:hypothetical protein
MKFLDKVERVFKFMDGKKTFALCALMLLKAFVKYSGNHDSDMLFDKAIEAITISTLRSGIGIIKR